LFIHINNLQSPEVYTVNSYVQTLMLSLKEIRSKKAQVDLGFSEVLSVAPIVHFLKKLD